MDYHVQFIRPEGPYPRVTHCPCHGDDHQDAAQNALDCYAADDPTIKFMFVERVMRYPHRESTGVLFEVEPPRPATVKEIAA